MLVRRRLLTTLLLLFCLVPLGMPLGMVLCVGADGHLAVEPVHDPAHRTTSPAVAGLLYQHVAQSPDGVDRNGPCVDAALIASEGGGQFITASETCPKPETPGSVHPLVMALVATAPPRPFILLDLHLASHHSLTLLRRVVLRI
jgi:hypothetical protein